MHTWTAVKFALVMSAVFMLAPRAGTARGSEAELKAANKLKLAYGKKDVLRKPKASKKHDRVTIIIDEYTTAKQEANTDLKAKSNSKVELAKWFTIKVDKDGNFVANPRTGPQKPNLEFTVDRKHKADAETERIQEFKSEISGEVIDVYPNGHLLVEAKSEMTINDEKQTLILTGRVDPKDLNDRSMVNAKFIIDKKIKFTGKGELTQTARRGWAARILDRFKLF